MSSARIFKSRLFRHKLQNTELMHVCRYVVTMEPDQCAIEAKKLIDNVIEDAIKNLEFELEEREKSIEALKSEMSRNTTLLSRQDFNIKDIGGLSIQEFSVERAEQKIDDLIQTWQYEDSWLHCIDFLGDDEHDYDTRYRFRVRWSIPTRRKPIPRATACIYFTFQVSKIKPQSYPVDVFYVFEANRLVHRPGESRFREKWLKDIIENKIQLIQNVKF